MTWDKKTEEELDEYIMDVEILNKGFSISYIKQFISDNSTSHRTLKTQFKKLARFCYFKATDKEPTEVVTLKDLEKLL